MTTPLVTHATSTPAVRVISSEETKGNQGSTSTTILSEESIAGATSNEQFTPNKGSEFSERAVMLLAPLDVASPPGSSCEVSTADYLTECVKAIDEKSRRLKRSKMD